MSLGDHSKKDREKKVHSVRFPRTFRDAATVVKKFTDKEGTLKKLVYEGNYRDKKRILPIATSVVKNYKKIHEILNTLNVFKDNVNFNSSVAVVLASEVIRKKGKLDGESKPILTINKYSEKIIEAFSSSTFESKVQKELPRYVRINTLVSSPEIVYAKLAKDGWTCAELGENISYDDYLDYLENIGARSFVFDYHVKNLLVFPPHTSFYKNPLYTSNAIVLQDKASCLPSFLSGIRGGEKVIDGCAAPGNKTSHLSAMMSNSGDIVAIDKDKKRCELMKKLLKERGVLNIQIMNKDFTSIDRSAYKDCDLILLDPSCSGSGTGLYENSKDQARIDNLSSFQSEILSFALSFPGVKVVVYSTCSIHQEENEEVVERVLKKFSSEFYLENLGERLAGWKNFGIKDFHFAASCIRTDSQIDRCQGFFVAKFVRKQRPDENVDNDDERTLNNHTEKTHIKEELSSLGTGEDFEETISMIKKESNINMDHLEKMDHLGVESPTIRENGLEKKHEICSEDTDMKKSKKRKRRKSKNTAVEGKMDGVDENGTENKHDTGNKDSDKKKSRSRKRKKSKNNVEEGEMESPTICDDLIENKREIGNKDSDKMKSRNRKRNKSKNTVEEVEMVGVHEKDKPNEDSNKMKSRKRKRNKSKNTVKMNTNTENQMDGVDENGCANSLKKKIKRKRKRSKHHVGKEDQVDEAQGQKNDTGNQHHIGKESPVEAQGQKKNETNKQRIDMEIQAHPKNGMDKPKNDSEVSSKKSRKRNRKKSKTTAAK